MILTDADLASYLRTPSLAGDADLEFLVSLVNGLIEEAWMAPVDPAPYSVRALAFTVAERAWNNPKGLSSWTRSIDDASRTERLPEVYARAGVYLTDDERAALNPSVANPPRKVRSVSLHVPRWCR